jgi:hypothetical protein
LRLQIDVCAAALTQAQTHKKRETEKATKQWPPMVLLDCTKCAHSGQNVQRDSDQKPTIFFSLSLSLSLSKIYKTSYGSWINIALWFYLSLFLSFSLSFSSANIYIHKSLNCNSKSRLIAAEVTELLMGISRGKEKGEQQQQRR